MLPLSHPKYFQNKNRGRVKPSKQFTVDLRIFQNLASLLYSDSCPQRYSSPDPVLHRLIPTRTSRHATLKHVQYRHVSPETRTKKNDVNGRSAICTNAAKNSTTKTLKARAQVVRN